MIDVDGNVYAIEKYLAEREAHEERDELLQAARDDAKEAEAFSEQLEDMLTIAMKALTRLSTSEVHGNGEALGCVLSSDPLGREIVARMEYARDIIAKIKGEQK